MGFAGAQRAADLHQEYGLVLMFTQKRGLPLLRGMKLGVAVLQLLRFDKQHLAGQIDGKLRILDFQRLVGDIYGVHDPLDNVFQIGFVPCFPGNDLFPVPLIHIDGMEVIHAFVAADGVHIGDKPLAGTEAVARKRVALPLCQRMYHLRLDADIGNVK